MSLLRQAAAWLAALVLVMWRLACRYRIHHDPRPALRARGQPYVYALLHAHQVAAVFVNDETQMAAMVSRSADGALLVPSLRLRRVRAVRGSSRKNGVEKGGRQALAMLADLVRERIPALLAVDGPRGPRNHVHRGIADLALACGATILPTVIVPTRRFVLTHTWDRMQLPQPFCTLHLIFGEPLEARPGEDALHLCARVAEALEALEAEHDPAEYALAQAHRRARARAAGQASGASQS